MEDKKFTVNETIVLKKISNDYYITTTHFRDYLLEDISAEIFGFIIDGMSYDQIIDKLCNEYSINRDVIREDTARYLDKMIKLGLILSQDGINEALSTTEIFHKNIKDISFEEESFNIYEKGHKNNIPINVDFHVTYKCNLKCKHCYAEERKECFITDKELSLNKIKNIFDELEELGTFFIRITGGEPFMHPQFMDILSYGRKKGFAMSIVTNGTLLNKEIAEQLKQIKLRELAFSIHGGSDAVHDAFVGQDGAFKKLKENLLICKNLGVPVRLTWTVTEDSVHETEEILKLSEDLGVLLSMSPRIFPQMDGNVNPKKCRLSTKNLVNFTRKFNYKPIVMECTAGEKVQINYDGTVQPCLFINDIIGNLKEESLKDIWNRLIKNRDSKYNCFKETPEKCISCDYKKHCHRCPGVAFIENGDAKTCSESAFWESEAYYLANL